MAATILCVSEQRIYDLHYTHNHVCIMLVRVCVCSYYMGGIGEHFEVI